MNGEGIYNTRPRDGALWSGGDAIRYTRSKDGRWTYAFSLRWPEEELVLASVPPLAGSEIHLLGYPEPLQWSHGSSRGLTVSLPNNLQVVTRQVGQFDWAFKIEAETG